MDDGVFHQGLEHQLGQDAVHKPLLHIDLAGEAVLEADALDIDVPFDQLQLFLQGDQLIPRNTGPEQLRQIGGDISDLRHPIGNAHPLDAVQGVIQEMGVQLGLHHAQLGFVQLLLPLDGARQILPVLRRHSVEAGRQTGKFIAGIGLNAHVIFALLHPAHGLIHLMHRLGQIPAQGPGGPQAQQQAQDAREKAHHLYRLLHRGGIGLRLLQHQAEAVPLQRLHAIVTFIPLPGQRLPGQQPVFQALHHFLRPGGLGAIDIVPQPVH